MRACKQIPVHPDDVQKTAITTPAGLFDFPFMSFGLQRSIARQRDSKHFPVVT
jgi:cytoskeleton-associated protein 5